MASQSRGAPSFSFAMFLALAAFGSYLWSTGPLESSRPPTLSKSAYYQRTQQAVPARLWQDPFRVVFDSLTDAEQVQLPRIQDTSLIGNISTQINNKELLILGVMMSTEAIAEAEERRRRRRYAVVSALGKEGYVPDDAKHIQATLLPPRSSDDANMFVMPFEWFHLENNENSTAIPKILVIWLDSSHFTHTPFQQFYEVAETLSSDCTAANRCKRLRFVILGPSGSGTLRTMAKRTSSIGIESLYDLGLGGFHILSPIATIAENILYRDIPKPKDRLHNRFSFENCTQPGRTCLTFHRTILTDNSLMNTLVLELKARGKKDDKNHIVLISELDTSFGRALPESFKQSFCTSESCEKRYIHTYSYLRGIDGVAPGTQDIGRSTAKSTQQKDKADPLAQQDAAAIRRPVGTGQFDYLRRFADDIMELDHKWRKEDGKGITAIGILGSDVYDKLLILRALRPKLLGVNFFTTDLDAQLLHPGEYRWTRNLIVASSFDLKLQPYLQGKILPFRDNYQTAIFYSAQLALKLSAKNPLKQELELTTSRLPLLFEVSRYGAVHLNPVPKDRDHSAYNEAAGRESEVFNPLVRERHRWAAWFMIIGISGLGILALMQLQHNRTYEARWLGLALLVAASISAMGIYLEPTEEPFALFSGISVWPTEIIIGLSLVLSLYFICNLTRGLTHNYREIGRSYALTKLLLTWPGDAKLIAHKPMSEEKKEPKAKRDWINVFVSMLLISALLVWILPRMISYQHAYVMIMIWFLVFITWFVIINRIVPLASINQWMRTNNIRGDIHIYQFWAEYGEYGSMRNRFLRAFTVVLIFQAFLSFVFLLFGLEPSPIRGERTALLDSFLIVPSLLSMLFLLFLVVDATRLCIVWVRTLTQHDFDWRGTGVEELSASMHMPWMYAIYWLRLKVIAERTGEVSKLIYYPFIVIVLMLISRISYFDNWGFPQSLAIITGAIVLIAVFAALKLRQVAEKVRDEAIDYLRNERIAVAGGGSGANRPSLDQIDKLIDNISAIKGGAFQPFLEQPVVKACLLLVGGVGFTASQFSAFLY